MDLYVDGASSGNPGLSGAGIVLVAEGIHEQVSLFLGEMTNHEAEFMAAKRGLELALTYKPDFIRLYSDSKIVVASIEKEYVKNPLFKPHLDEVLLLAGKVPLFFTNYLHVSQNKQADKLARQAIQQAKKRGIQG
ncbi:ribonuclease HI [Listeria floridensis FSL S10-1187]|uniref:Ribonuclease HI n=1 Tax=Listeria floridensis FSL S10-1187 TaxID=1265817 RepID=A0ABP3B1P5_9LIST|nr:ribonuclease HI family protein [Listeria floridensis]EUJ32978.1 ribonuclease HI [Listeria floridensis FSL S10-1187]